jgi:plastocyanin
MRSIGLSILTILSIGCGGGDYGTGPQQGGTKVVNTVGVTAWNPTAITITAGDTVTFNNPAAIAHNVRFDDVAGRPGDVADFASSSKAITFPTAGTYTYHCGIHPAMQGSVVVQP